MAAYRDLLMAVDTPQPRRRTHVLCLMNLVRSADQKDGGDLESSEQ